MALTNTLGEIGDAIREKTGGTELIPLKEMADAIRTISTGGTSVQNPLEYAIDVSFENIAFPENYELKLVAPKLKELYATFWRTTGIRKITIEGNESGNAISAYNAFRECPVEEIDLTNFVVTLSNAAYCFYNSTNLVKILGTIDLTNATNITNMFAGCDSLQEVRFKPLSIFLATGFSKCSKLSAESVQSIIDGLATVETAPTLKLHTAITPSDTQKNTIANKGWTLVY